MLPAEGPVLRAVYIWFHSKYSIIPLKTELYRTVNTHRRVIKTAVELHLSGIGTASHAGMQKIRIIGFSVHVTVHLNKFLCNKTN
jgi:hypothetical protein